MCTVATTRCAAPWRRSRSGWTRRVSCACTAAISSISTTSPRWSPWIPATPACPCVTVPPSPAADATVLPCASVSAAERAAARCGRNGLRWAERSVIKGQQMNTRILGGIARAHRASIVLVIAALLTWSLLQTATAATPEQSRWERQAQAATITRDDWGIAHVHGKTDADAVFGMAYAQAEDDFNRVETNYLIALGRLAEAKDADDSALWQDLRQRLFIDPAELKKLYAQSPRWLRQLMDSWADGLNYYLATHPDVHPRVLTRFEPWMALSFTEGSIGGDIERVELAPLKAFYGSPADAPLAQVHTQPSWIEPTGSNGIAIAPKLTADGHALLLINPHTSFFFRSELQMSSDEGLNAYGAVTWGQFFIYQGFNPHVGWMHTSTGVDVVDEFAETIVHRDGKLFYRYGKELRPVTSRQITLSYRDKSGALAQRTFTAHFTHHGPIVREADGKWIAEALMNKPIPALEQSWLRTRTHDLAS